MHLVTEGPLGWSALAAAVKLKIPCSSDFHTNFHSYSKHYGIGWLKKPIAAYLRRFHNKASCTLVPTATMLEISSSTAISICAWSPAVSIPCYFIPTNAAWRYERNGGYAPNSRW